MQTIKKTSPLKRCLQHQQHSVKSLLKRASSNIIKNNYILFVIKSIIWGAAMEAMVGFFIASQQANVKQHVLSVNKPFYDCVKERRFLNQICKKNYSF